MTKNIVLNDSLDSITEEIMRDQQNDTAALRGIVVVSDGETGEVLFTKKNTIVIRGRTFALEKMFNASSADVTGFNNNLNRSICLFKVGSGGTPASSPFTPLQVSALDTDLANAVPFRTMATADVAAWLQTPEGQAYTNVVAAGSNSNIMMKTFDSSSWVYDTTNASKTIIARKLTITISEKDCRGALINELGLFIASYTNSSYSNFEMVSRLTMDTEAMGLNNKSLSIQYYIYA
jgi:hypothetical protein